MAGISFTTLVSQFIRELERSGATVLETASASFRPARVRIISTDATTDCLVFLWTVTPGGGGPSVRPANERRIQVTSATSFPLQPGSTTIVGGWSEEFGVYAFWDPRRHSHFTRGSPSFQVNSETLEKAQIDGIATQVKPAAEGREVVVAVEPRSLQWYIQNGQSLHNADADASFTADLISATPEEERVIIDTSANESQAARRFELVQTMRAFREARFRPDVLQAYSYRCAICGYALKLVDAAHIIPVSHPQSTDEIINGLALCRLHHGAYDNGLLGVRSDYKVITNPAAIRRLRSAALLEGFEKFQQGLPEEIRIPASLEVRPKPEYLKMGLTARLWPVMLVA